MRTLVAICALAVGAPPISAQRVEKNVIFGMYSGLALLMDVRYPTAPKGRGVIFVPGSGFGASLRQDATPLKDANPAEVHALTDAGYTVFMVSHRAAPRFTYPAAVEDVQRAVRFVRANADRFGIDPQRIGAAGMSSGGHLVSVVCALTLRPKPERRESKP